MIHDGRQQIVLNAALGFDTYLVMRHGARAASASASRPNAQRLGCYYCNDIVAPADVRRSLLFPFYARLNAERFRTHSPSRTVRSTRCVPSLDRGSLRSRRRLPSSCSCHSCNTRMGAFRTPFALPCLTSFTLSYNTVYTPRRHHPKPPPPPPTTPPTNAQVCSASSHTSSVVSSPNSGRSSSPAPHTTSARGAPRPSCAHTNARALGCS